MKICQSCLLNSNYRNIKFDKFGICNYCQTYNALEEKITAFDANGKLLEDRFNLFRGKYEYDCLVGISGGKDSSYVVYQLKNKYGLKILTFTFDNGFLTDYAKKNIELLVQKLKVDNFFYKPDWDIYKEFYRQSILHFGYTCPVCAYSSYAFSNKVAFEKRIPFCVHGRSPAQMFKELLNESLDPFLPFIWNNLSPYNTLTNKETAQKVIRKSDYFLKRFIPDPKLRKIFYKEFFPDKDSFEGVDQLPEFLGLFLYEKYDEASIKAVIARELGWLSSSDSKILTHSDCMIHDAAMFLYNQVFDYSLLSLELSVMIRQGNISREEGTKRLHLEKCLNAVPYESVSFLLNSCRLEIDQMKDIISKARRRHKLIRFGLRIQNKFKELGRNGAADPGKSEI